MLICLELCCHMPICFDLCSLHALYYFPCACALHAMFVCLDLGYVCHAICYCSPFVSFVSLPCVLAYCFGSDLDPLVLILIYTPWSISKGLDHPYLRVYACLLICFMLMFASLVLGFVTFDALSGFVVMWLHLRPCLGVSTWEASPDAGSLCAYLCPLPFCAMICLPCLFAPPVGFLCIFTRLLTCPCMNLAY